MLGAEEKIFDLEYQLFIAIRDDIADRYTGQVLKLAKTLARLDVFAGLAEVALQGRFVPPRGPLRRYAFYHGGPSPGR